MDSKFNLLRIHNSLFARQFSSLDKLYCEFHIQTALKRPSSSNTLKRVFSIMHLIDCTKSKYSINPVIMISIILMLLSDTDARVRSSAMRLAQTVAQQDSKAILDVFADTTKPQSAKKAATRPDYSPMKPKKAQLFLEELLRYQSEIC